MSRRTPYQKCYSLACYYLAKRDYSILELTKKLVEKEHSKQEIDKVISSLIKLDILNDEKFALGRVRYRYQTCRWGVVRIRRELQEKGVEKELIEQAIEQRYEDGTLKDSKITEQAFDLIFSRYRTKVNLENGRLNAKDYNKIVGFLIRRGYTFSQVREALSLFVEKLIEE